VDRGASGPPALSKSPTQKRRSRAGAIIAALNAHYPAATCTLDFRSPVQLLVATILSAQCTDERVNLVTRDLFRRYPDATALARASQEELELAIRSIGLFRSKARSLRECCADLVDKHGGEVPNSREALMALRGVGRKTAHVVLGTAFGVPALTVDTHVKRLSNRLGLTRENDPLKIERDLAQLLPEAQWNFAGHALIQHGRQVCTARKPDCETCFLRKLCPYPERS